MSQTDSMKSRAAMRLLPEEELGAVAGGETKAKSNGHGSFFEALAKAWGDALNKQADAL
jgi:hypothetical protein